MAIKWIDAFKYIKRLIIGLYILSCSVYSYSLPQPAIYMLEGGRTIELPADSRIVKKDDGGDFVLYYILDSEQQGMLSLFVGNFPNHEDIIPNDHQKITIANFERVEGGQWKCELKYCAQIYVDIGGVQKSVSAKLLDFNYIV